MIDNLNLKYGFEVWVNKMLVQTIESEFKKQLETEDLNYYYILCNPNSNKSNKTKGEVKWVGKINLIDFIKKVQSLNKQFCPIGVTNAKSKKELVDFFDNHFFDNRENLKAWDYCIGDVSYQDMITGDDLFIQLWERVRDKVTSIPNETSNINN